MQMHRKISLRLDADLADRLQMRADRERVPVSCLLRHLVVRLLDGSPVGERPALSPHRQEAPSHLKSRTEQLQAEFMSEVCSTYDSFRGQGHDWIVATKLTNKALKAKNHPWATYEVVQGVLRKAGRYRKQKLVS
ncbi:MAG: hypothetical protein FPO08_01020 [Geobacter sp.]|nr:MAG: hypothetical protein FPO08_01020 [Geobacter sp.]